MAPDRGLSDDLDLAFRVADTASAISRGYFRREIDRWSKADGSIATEADLAVEDAIRAQLGCERPDDAMLGEERGLTGVGPRRWIVDGIDGTIDFAAGTPNWGTLVALESGGQIAVGVYDQPIHGRRYWATKGGGAWSSCEADRTPLRIHVSGEQALGRSRSYITGPEWLTDDHSRAIASALIAATTPRPLANHPAIMVATGASELTVFMRAGPWDIAALWLIVEEAGGRFSDFEGARDLASGNAVFSNRAVHDEVLRVLAHSG